MTQSGRNLICAVIVACLLTFLCYAALMDDPWMLPVSEWLRLRTHAGTNWWLLLAHLAIGVPVFMHYARTYCATASIPQWCNASINEVAANIREATGRPLTAAEYGAFLGLGIAATMALSGTMSIPTEWVTVAVIVWILFCSRPPLTPRG
jgi:hypothetical protein